MFASTSMPTQQQRTIRTFNTASSVAIKYNRKEQNSATFRTSKSATRHEKIQSRRLRAQRQEQQQQQQQQQQQINNNKYSYEHNGVVDQITKEIDLIILDCDGVIWHGDQLIPGAKQSIDFLRSSLKKRVIFCTNNSQKTREYYQWKFEQFGIEVDLNDIYTSAYQSAMYLQQLKGYDNAQVAANASALAVASNDNNKGDQTTTTTTNKQREQMMMNEQIKAKKIYCIGEYGLKKELEIADVGDLVGGVYEAVQCTSEDWEEMFEWTGGNSEDDLNDDSKVDCVVVGQDLSFTFAKLAYASYLIQKGALFIATNTDSGDRLGKEKLLMPGAGPIVKAIEIASGKKPDVICGKPNALMFQSIMSMTNAKPERTMVIGDRIDTDIKFGNDNNAKYSVLVLTGANSVQDCDNAMTAEDSQSSMVPSFICGSLAEVCKINYDPNEKPLRLMEKVDMLKTFPVSDGAMPDLWASSTDGDDDYDSLIMMDDEDDMNM